MGLCHMEHWCGFSRVVDDIVVYVIVVDDVGNVTSIASSCFPLDSLISWIQVRVSSCSTGKFDSAITRAPLVLFKPSFIFTLLCHRVLSQILLGFTLSRSLTHEVIALL